MNSLKHNFPKSSAILPGPLVIQYISCKWCQPHQKGRCSLFSFRSPEMKRERRKWGNFIIKLAKNIWHSTFDSYSICWLFQSADYKYINIIIKLAKNNWHSKSVGFFNQLIIIDASNAMGMHAGVDNRVENWFDDNGRNFHFLFLTISFILPMLTVTNAGVGNWVKDWFDENGHNFHFLFWGYLSYYQSNGHNFHFLFLRTPSILPK